MGSATHLGIGTLAVRGRLRRRWADAGYGCLEPRTRGSGQVQRVS